MIHDIVSLLVVDVLAGVDPKENLDAVGVAARTMYTNNMAFNPFIQSHTYTYQRVYL